MKLEEALASKIAKKSASELKGLGASRDILFKVGFTDEELDILFVETPAFGVSMTFLKENNVKGTERSYMLPTHLKLNEKMDVLLVSVIFALSKANRLLYPNLPTTLKTEKEITDSVGDGTISKYNSVGCFIASDQKQFRMGILDEVIQRTSAEYTLACTRKADAASQYDIIDILPR